MGYGKEESLEIFLAYNERRGEKRGVGEEMKLEGSETMIAS